MHFINKWSLFGDNFVLFTKVTLYTELSILDVVFKTCLTGFNLY
jgi:hypothetical protein